MKRTAIAFLVLASILAGCGSGGGSSTDTKAPAALAPAAAAEQGREAEAICERMTAAAGRMGSKALGVDPGDYESSLEFTTEGLIAPALPVVERSAAELRELEAGGAEAKLTAFVNLFDPILALLIERVRAGRQGDGTEAHELELQLVELVQIQRTLAQEAGLKGCDIDFVGAFSRPAS